MTPKPIAGCGSSPCPKCNESAPCVDHSEVDIGIGSQTFDHEYWCPTHGGFSFVEMPGMVATFGAVSRHAVFRSDAEDDPEPATENK